MIDTHECPNCGYHMSECRVPKEWVLLSIGRVEVRLWWWTTVHECAFCVNEHEADIAGEIFEDGFEKGYSEGFEDANRLEVLF